MLTPNQHASNVNACTAALPAFRAAITAHVPTIPAEIWADYRERARMCQRVAPEFTPLPPDAPRDQVALGSVCEDALSLREVLDFAPASFVQVATVADQPVHFSEDTGIYVWAPNPDSGHCLQAWMTFPAYPPGW